MADRRYIQRLADDRFEGEIRNRFEEALSKIQDDTVLEDIARRIEAGDVEGAIAAVGISAAAFDGVKDASRNAMAAAGRESAKEVGLGIQFAPGNPRAERRVDELHTQLVREVTDETRDAIREEIEYGLNRGDNPKKTARRIRGQWNAQYRRYEGGTIGLTRHQASVVRKAREELESGDPQELRRYLGRKLRDRRHDPAILKAINEERPLTQEQIDKIETSYRRRWVKHRSETIARDQSLEALSLGQEESIDQAVDEGNIREQDLLKQWVNSSDSRVRDAHDAVPSMNRGGVPRNGEFDTPLGPLRRPRDRSSSGSVPRNVINCRCTLTYSVRRRR